jgi:outer membrane protein OmpA-like peptidoglycan-associated protein
MSYVAGPVENNGCPWPDTDGDGVIDKDDACPTVAGPVENNGCPWPDTDGDGILDKDDACPTVPGLPEYNGCPKPKTAEEVTVALKDILFNFNKATLRPESNAKLDQAAKSLKMLQLKTL